MNDKTKTEITEEDGLEVRTVEVTRNGKTRTFQIKESSYGLINKISASLNQADDAKKLVALESFGANMISASCYEDGKRLTFEQASNLPGQIGRRLEKESISINAMDAAAKDEAKNA